MSTANSKDADDGSSADESIGRPSEWREGRYEKTGADSGQSVLKKEGEAPSDTLSTPVTQKDYEGTK